MHPVDRLRNRTKAGTTEGRGARRRWRMLLPGALCALLLAGQLHDYPSVIGHNGTYICLATALSQGLGFVDIADPGNPPHFNYPFLLPALLTPARWLFPDALWPMKLVCSLFALAGVLLLPRCLCAQGRRSTLHWAALLLATHALFLVAGVTVDTTAAFVVFSLLAISAVRRYREGSRALGPAFAQAWLWLSAVYLVRTIGIGLLAAAAAYLLWHRCWRKVAVLALALMLSLGLWWARSHWVAAERGVPGFFHVREALHAEGLSGRAAYEPTRYDDRLDVGKTWGRVVENCRYYFGIVPTVLFPGYFVNAGWISSDMMPFFGRAAFTPSLCPIANARVFRGVLCSVLLALLALGIGHRMRHGVQLEEVYVLAFVAMFVLWPHQHEQPLLLILPLLLTQLVDGARLVGRGVAAVASERARPAVGGVLLACSLTFIAVNLTVPVRVVTANVDWNAATYASREAQLAAIYRDRGAAEFAAADYIRHHTPPDSHITWTASNADIFAAWSGRKISELPEHEDPAETMAEVRAGSDYLVIVPGRAALRPVWPAIVQASNTFLVAEHRVKVGDMFVIVARNTARPRADAPSPRRAVRP